MVEAAGKPASNGVLRLPRRAPTKQKHAGSIKQAPGRCPRAWLGLHFAGDKACRSGCLLSGCVWPNSPRKHRGSGRVGVTPQAESLTRSACSRALEPAVRSEQRADPGSLPYGNPRTTTRATAYCTSRLTINVSAGLELGTPAPAKTRAARSSVESLIADDYRTPRRYRLTRLQRRLAASSTYKKVRYSCMTGPTMIVCIVA